MRKISVSFNDELVDALDEYVTDQAEPVTASDVLRAALREYLHRRGYLEPRKVLRITPALLDDPGSVEIRTDHALADSHP